MTGRDTRSSQPGQDFGERPAGAPDGGTGRTGYHVAALKPFWRYAVALDDRPDIPAIPYYRKAAALAFYDESRADLPWADTVVLKKRFRTVTVLRPQGASPGHETDPVSAQTPRAPDGAKEAS